MPEPSASQDGEPIVGRVHREPDRRPWIERLFVPVSGFANGSLWLQADAE